MITIGCGLNLDNDLPTVSLNSLLPESVKNKITREEYLSSFFNIFEKMYTVFDSQGFDPFVDQYTSSWLHSGQVLKLNDGTTVTVEGLSKFGYLLAKDGERNNYELHPDGNSLDFFNGLIKTKIN